MELKEHQEHYASITQISHSLSCGYHGQRSIELGDVIKIHMEVWLWDLCPCQIMDICPDWKPVILEIFEITSD